MGNSKDKTIAGGIGFLGALTILFIAFKLTKVIAWSWWWVLSPWWIPAGLVLIGGAIYVTIKWNKHE